MVEASYPGPGLVNDAAVMADPFTMYAAWRTEGPVVRSTTPDGAPVWIITGYQDVRRALADPRLSLDKRHSIRGYRGFELPRTLDANLLNLDPPDHTRIRRLVSKAFAPHRVGSLRPRVERITGDLLDAVYGREESDLVAELAAPLPLTVIGELLGVPDTGRSNFRRWSDAVFAPDPTRPSRAGQAIAAMQDYLVALIGERRNSPGDDLLSAMIAARDGADQLNEDELLSLAFLILVAGYENTINSISCAVRELLRHPDQWALLRERPELAAATTDEVLRYASPTPFAIRRFATEDIRFGSTTVPAGETVLACIASAHHDPRQFAEPDRFDIQRRDNRHLGYGHGIHYCIGAPLAHIEVETALVGLVRRFPALTLAIPDPDLRWRPSWRSRGLLHLPVRLRG